MKAHGKKQLVASSNKRRLTSVGPAVLVGLSLLATTLFAGDPGRRIGQDATRLPPVEHEATDRVGIDRIVVSYRGKRYLARQLKTEPRRFSVIDALAKIEEVHFSPAQSIAPSGTPSMMAASPLWTAKTTPIITGLQRDIAGTLPNDVQTKPYPNTLKERGRGDDPGDDSVSQPLLGDFSPTPLPVESRVHDGAREQWVYDAKFDVPTQHPWVEWGRIFYGDGITPRGKDWLGPYNLVRPKFYVYGDLRSAIASGRNDAGRTDNWANRLNLDLDLQVTDTERFHAFVGPLDGGGSFTRLERVGGDFRFRNEIDLTPVTGFFEGDLGSILGGLTDQGSPFELPFTVGLVPLLFQNGIWFEDAVTGAAFSLPARHSRALDWANFDATFFAVFDQLESPAFGNDPNVAQAFGTAWFIDAYGGYIESGYAFVNDRTNSDRSYHNVTVSFTRRYFDRISNSVRVIVNAGQQGDRSARTADGALLLVENSWITSTPLTVVPYANFFVGWNRPQSVGRAGVSGGILRNTGINFDTDGLNGFATLDPTGHDTAGGSVGVDLIGKDLDRQLLLELTYLTPHGDSNPRVAGDQFAIGTRYQFPISHRTLLRFDAMHGWRRGLRNVYGTRLEYRWKF